MTPLLNLAHDADILRDQLAWRWAGMRLWTPREDRLVREPTASHGDVVMRDFPWHGTSPNEHGADRADGRMRSLGRAIDRVYSAVLARPLAPVRAFVLAGTATVIAIGTSLAFVSSATLLQTADRMVMRDVSSADGTALGAVPGPAPLYDRLKDQRSVLRATLPESAELADFRRIAGEAEGFGIFGVAPHSTARAIMCRAAQGIGAKDIAWLGLEDGLCDGGSTLMQQAVRVIDGDRSDSNWRKARQIMGSIGLSLRLDNDDEWRFIQRHLFFGFAAGEQLIGVEAASRATFGIPSDRMDLAENAWLVASLKYPLRLRCNGSKVAAEHQELVRGRAIYWLMKSHAGDPRLDAAIAKLKTMAPSAVMPDETALAIGAPPERACEAGASPLLRFRRLTGTAGLLAEDEASRLPAGEPLVMAMQLETQSTLQRDVWAAMEDVAREQAGQWQKPPVQALGFVLVTQPDGAITGAVRTSPLFKLDAVFETGSIAKLYAAAFLAEKGWGERDFCNRSATHNGKVLHNAGGDAGAPVCAGRALMKAPEVWGRSLSLPVFDALKSFTDTELRIWMADHGLLIAPGQSAAYQVAFGLARTTPGDLSAFLSAYSAGVSGAKPLGYAAYALKRPEAAQRVPIIDLGHAFAAPGGQRLLEQAGTAALRYRAGGDTGTLASLSARQPAYAIAKSGTLDNIAGKVRFKGAVGAQAGHAWQVLFQPNPKTDALGTSQLSILPVARAAATTTFP